MYIVYNMNPDYALSAFRNNLDLKESGFSVGDNLAASVVPHNYPSTN
jgi:hypothetical protein